MSNKQITKPTAPKSNPKPSRRVEPAEDSAIETSSAEIDARLSAEIESEVEDQFEDDTSTDAHADAAASGLGERVPEQRNVRSPRIDRWGDDLDVQDGKDADTFYDEDDFDESWLQRLNLEAPEPRPGFDQRWVATKIMGEDQPVNATRQYRQGWRPRDPVTIPSGYFPQVEDPDGHGYVGFAGLVLMERPMRITRRAQQLLKEETRRRTRSIDSQLREKEESGLPFQISRRTQVTNRRPVQVAED